MNAVQTHSAAGLANAARLALRVEKPPVPSVEKAWQSASSQPMPQRRSSAVCAAVSAT